jgi:RNA polymerase sigma-70 factor (ECF subfamily)
MEASAVSEESSFQDLMGRLRAGDGSAADEVFRRFAGRLIALARGRLDRVLRRRADPEDVLQSVLRSFFHRYGAVAPNLDDWDGLWALLTTITVRKCGRRVRFHRQACRDARREVTADPADDASWAGWEALAREPDPAEAAALAETVEALLRDQDERDRQIVVLTLQGFSREEVAAQVGSSRRTAERVLERVRRRLERMQDGEAADVG